MDWQQAWLEDHTPWDLRQVTPPLTELLASGEPARWGMPESARVAVPGCGRGHDLRAWARHGHAVTGFEVVPRAVDEARALLAWNRVRGAEVLCRDVLGIDAEFARHFDVVYDHTCLCAVAPHLRRRLGCNAAEILVPGGLWIGLVFPLAPAGYAERPPYRLTADAVHAALGEDFTPVAEREAVGSVPSRWGHERWFVFRRR